MDFILKWMDLEIDNFYIAGAIFDSAFNESINEQIVQAAKQGETLVVRFLHIEDILVIQSIGTVIPEDDFYYVLDDYVLEFLNMYLNKREDIWEIVAILAIQYFEFDVLKEIVSLSPVDIEKLGSEERDFVISTQEQINTMSDDLKKVFFEQELFCYEKEDLESYLSHLQKV